MGYGDPRETRESHSPCAIRTKAHAVKRTTQFGLVFRMALQVTQLMNTMSELTFITVFAFTSFLERTTQFRLVTIEEREVL